MTPDSWVPACGLGWRSKSKTPLNFWLLQISYQPCIRKIVLRLASTCLLQTLGSMPQCEARGHHLGHFRIFSPFMESFVSEQHVLFRADFLSVTSDLRFHDSAGSVASFSYLKYWENFKNLLVWNLNAYSLDIWYGASSSGFLPSLSKMAPSWGWHDLRIDTRYKKLYFTSVTYNK